MSEFIDRRRRPPPRGVRAARWCSTQLELVMGWSFDAEVFVAYGSWIEFETTKMPADTLFRMLLHKTEEQETMDEERKRRKDVANAGLLTRSGQLPISLTSVIVGAATAAEAAKPDAQDQESDDDSPEFGPEPPDGGWWLTDRAREAFKKLVEITGGYVYDPDEHHFDLVWNYQYLWAEVFDIFAERVLGEEHGLALKVMTSHAVDPADTYILIHDKTMQVRGEGSAGAEGGRGSIQGVPYGVDFTRIPTGADTSASDAKFEEITEALGDPFITPSWLLVTYYDSG